LLLESSVNAIGFGEAGNSRLASHHWRTESDFWSGGLTTRFARLYVKAMTQLSSMVLYCVRVSARVVVSAIIPFAALRAQSVSDLQAGVRLRVSVERATNDGIERLWMTGTLVSADSSHSVIRRDAQMTPTDTLALFGVHRLDVFRGVRPRGPMIRTGAELGAAAGIITWIVARQLYGSASTNPGTDSNGAPITSSRTVTAIARLSIPVVTLAGGVIGALIGPEHWERVPVPSSMFPEAR
jgi:hypothetical protein